MRSSLILFPVFLSIGFTGCKEKTASSSAENNDTYQHASSLEQLRKERKHRRQRLAQNQELYQERLHQSAKNYTQDRANFILNSNQQIFQQRHQSYLKKHYLPFLKQHGVQANSFPESFPPVAPHHMKAGVNFCSGDPFFIQPQQPAGLPFCTQTHWNNITSPNKEQHNQGTSNHLLTDKGTLAKNLKLSWKGRGPVNWWSKPVPGADGSLRLMGSHLEGHAQVTVQGLHQANFQHYDLVVYIEYILRDNQQNGADSPLGRIDLWSTAERKHLLASDLIRAVKVRGIPHAKELQAYSHQPENGKKFVCANTGRHGHYLYFSKLTAPNFHLQVHGAAFGHLEHIRLAGFQIIQRPPVSSSP